MEIDEKYFFWGTARGVLFSTWMQTDLATVEGMLWGALLALSKSTSRHVFEKELICVYGGLYFPDI